MPEIDGVQYSGDAFEHMRQLYGLRKTALEAGDADEAKRLLGEAEHIHDWHKEFPGLVWHDLEAEERGAALAPTPAQSNLFDQGASEAAKLEGMAKAERGTDLDWRRRAIQAILEVAAEKEKFTADDIWEKVEKPREPRALGPLMTSAVKRGICEPTGRVLQSRIPVHHQAPVREYRSLVG